MTAAERLLLEAELEAAEAKARRLREGLRDDPSDAAWPRRPKGKRSPALPKAPTAEEQAKAAANLDEAAWSRYERRHGIRRTA